MAFEYFDIPYRYNETNINLIFQNPYTLFVFWDICDVDEKAFIEKYGEDIYYNSRIYLKLTNISKNYYNEIDINPFAKSWYIHIDNPNCKYVVELCRKINTSELSIVKSNELMIPADMPNININNTFDFINIKTHTIEFSLTFDEGINVTNSHLNLSQEDLQKLQRRNSNLYKNIINNPGSLNNVSSGTRYNT